MERPSLQTRLPAPYYDVNRDGFTSPADALFVINRLNATPNGEGEASESTTDVAANQLITGFAPTVSTAVLPTASVMAGVTPTSADVDLAQPDRGDTPTVRVAPEDAMLGESGSLDEGDLLDESLLEALAEDIDEVWYR